MFKLTALQNGKQYEIAFDRPSGLEQLLGQVGLTVPHPCGGRANCGKCMVELGGNVSPPNEAEKKLGKRLSCQAIILGDAWVKLPDTDAMRVEMDVAGFEEARNPMPGRLGAAIDLGTTTIAVRGFDLRFGRSIGIAAGSNPQISTAGDVMGRIDAALNGKLVDLQDQVAREVEELIREALKGKSPDALVISGNTTMLYLLCGLSPKSLAYAPFNADDLFDKSVNLFGTEAYLPPCMNAFVGADITCAVLFSGMCQQAETSLLCDFGTNGEIALWKDGILFVTSTAAGPAFEGAGISCGCGSVSGAIEKVSIEEGEICVGTIGGEAPVGLCGSGLIDAVAAGIKLGVIDETGAIDGPFQLEKNISLSQGDIRAVQLAKAAIAAGIEAVMKAAWVSGIEEVDTLYIAGGFGSHLNIESAKEIGLLPKNMSGKVHVLGNAALAGASQVLLDLECKEQLRSISRVSKHVSLGGNPQFNESYIDNMLF